MAREHRRRLRAALVFHGQVIADVTLAPGAGLRVGASGAQTLAVRPVGLCEGFEVLRSAVRGERGVLRVTTAVPGWVCLGGREQSLADLVWGSTTTLRMSERAVPVLADEDDEPVCEATVYEVELGPEDWGVLVLGESELVFQWVRCETAPWRFEGAGGLVWWAEPARRPVFGLAVLASLLAQGAVLFAASWPLPARSAGSVVAIAPEERAVEYVAGPVEEVRERPMVGRVRHEVRRMLQRVGSARPAGADDEKDVGEEPL